MFAVLFETDVVFDVPFAPEMLCSLSCLLCSLSSLLLPERVRFSLLFSMFCQVTSQNVNALQSEIIGKCDNQLVSANQRRYLICKKGGIFANGKKTFKFFFVLFSFKHHIEYFYIDLHVFTKYM